MDVLVVGALHHDVIVSAPRLPELDETLKGQSVTYALGGKGGNQALAAALHGVKTAFAGAVGNDEAGVSMKHQLEIGGVDTAQIATDFNRPSGMSVAIVTGSGDYGAVIVSSANETIDGDLITLPEGLKWLVLQNEVLPEINILIANKAAQAGIKILLNAAPAENLDPRILELADLLVVNRVEAKTLGTAIFNIKGAVVETRGGDGANLFPEDGGSEFIAPFKVTVVSTHGAGDCFVGALAARLCFGDSLPQALVYASAAAALHVSLPIDARKSIAPGDVLKLMETRHADGH